MTVFAPIARLFRRRHHASASAVAALPGDNGVIVTAVRDPATGALHAQVEPDELTSIARRIEDHLAGSEAHQHRLAGLLDALPGLLDGLTTVRRQGVSLTESMNEQLERASRRDQSLQVTIDRLRQGSSQHAEALTVVQRHLEATASTTTELAGGLASLQSAVADIADVNRRLLGGLADRASLLEAHQRGLAGEMAGQRRLLVIAVIAAVVSAVAAAGAVVALFARGS